MSQNIYKVPIVNGEMDINYDYLIKARAISDSEAIVVLREGYEPKKNWIALDESYLNEFKKLKDEKDEENLNDKLNQIENTLDIVLLKLEEIL